MKSKQEKIDDLVNQIQEFADIRYRINKETDYCNHFYVVKTLIPEYEEHKKLLKEKLKNLVDSD